MTKRKTLLATLLFITFTAALGRTNLALGKTSRHDIPDSTQTNYTTVEPAEAELKTEQDKIWKKRAKYINLSFGLQNIKSDYKNADSEMAFAIMLGRTYYLHKKPIAGILKFGIDWNYIDINFAKYPDLPSSPDVSIPADTELADLGIMQLEAGMGVGPSVTVNPVSHMKACLYFHVTPSYSMLLQNSELYHHYATFFNTGLTISYKVISLGIEHRWCGKTNYDGVALARLDNIYDDAGNFNDPFKSFGAKMRTSTFRIFIGFRY